MKKLILFIVLFVCCCYADRCANVLEREVDVVTGVETLMWQGVASKHDHYGLLIRVIRNITSTSVIFSINTVGAAPCISANEKVFILYADSTRRTIISHGKFNCDRQIIIFLSAFADGSETPIARGNSGLINELRTKKILIMRALTLKGHVEVQFPDDVAQGLKDAFNCIVDSVEPVN